MERASDQPRWHEALWYAVTGERRPDLAGQAVPDLEAVLADFTAEETADLMVAVRDRVDTGQVWPHPVPVDLMVGLGAAQFTAALAMLRSRLGLDAAIRRGRVSRNAQPSPGDERLRREVPPHHGAAT